MLKTIARFFGLRPKAPPLPTPPPAVGLKPWGLPEKGEQSLYVVRAVDGDTLECALLVPVTVRVNGINAPEHDAPGGPEATAAMQALVGAKLMAGYLYGREKYGRLLADLWLGDAGWLSKQMIATGHAKPWDGKGPRP